MYLLAEGDILDWSVHPICTFRLFTLSVHAVCLCSPLRRFLGCFYWGDPDKSLANVLWPTGVYWGEDDDKGWSRERPPHDVGVLLWTLGYIGAMVLFAWALQRDSHPSPSQLLCTPA